MLYNINKSGANGDNATCWPLSACWDTHTVTAEGQQLGEVTAPHSLNGQESLQQKL
jgi:hypothetical protein